jgi:hypothetical protein
METETTMSIGDKRKYFQVIAKRYHNSSKERKGIILGEFCAIFGFNRSYAIRLLNAGYRQKRKRPGVPSVYRDVRFVKALKQLWWASEWSCGKLLKSAIPLLLPHLERHRKAVEPEIRALLLRISPASIDRVLAPYKAKHRKGRRLTKPGSLLRDQIPISTEVWDTAVPGYIEADTVAHCGSSSQGPFVLTLTMTDIATQWTENRAVWTKLAENTVAAIRDIEQALPFAIKGFDCDNGSEFLNDHLVRYFQGREIKLTRSRPYRKNDNAHVEQKNWTSARQLLGYARLENPELVPLINDIYANEWSSWKNFFCPTFKLKEKLRIGSKIVRKYHSPQTPYQRVLESPEISDDVKQKLKLRFESLDPIELRERIEQKLKRVKALASTTFDNWLASQQPQ